MLHSTEEYQAELIRQAAVDEMDYIRTMGANRDLILCSTNLGAFEALLQILEAGPSGLPVYTAVENVQSRYSSASGIVGRLRMLRAEGLLEERNGKKKSQVCLVPSERLLNQLGPVLLARNHRSI